MLLLGVLIVASVIGTLYESNFDAKIARAYVYGAQWFNLWLLLLAANLACAAFSRMPWKKHHTGFLITHLGIIVLLAGSVIGKIWGIEGTVTLYKDRTPEHRLVIDEKMLHIREENGSRLVPLEVYNRKPSPERPRLIAKTSDGLAIEAIGHSNQLEVAMEAQQAPKGLPAVRISINTAMMNQTLRSWLLADHPEHGTYSMGLASIAFKKGTAPERAPKQAAVAQDIEEAVFAFEKIADQVTNVKKGGNTGVKVRLLPAASETERLVTLEYQGKKHEFKLAQVLGKTAQVDGTPFTMEVRDYWPDFRITKEGPQTLSQNPNNPAVLLFLRGNAVPIAPESQEQSPNSLTIYISEEGKYSYDLSSRKAGQSSGTLEVAKPLSTGWADWKITIEEALPTAQAVYVATPSKTEPTPKMGSDRAEGVLVRVQQNGSSLERWVPLGWPVELPVQPKPIRLTYGYRQEPLPISLQLKDFEVTHNEGTDTPAGFKSTLLVTDIKGNSATGQCWMNNPMSFPGSWLNTFSGLTYKISQASWNPQDLSQSSLQILRDPGWGLKWIGSLLICAGIFILFYLRPPKNFNKRPTQ